jgi:hypothetical protein
VGAAWCQFLHAFQLAQIKPFVIPAGPSFEMDQDARRLPHVVSRALLDFNYDAFIPAAMRVHRVNVIVQLKTGCVKWALKGFASTRPGADGAVDRWAPSFGADKLTGPELNRLE